MRYGRVLVLVAAVGVSVASASPTPEEQALKAALAGRHGEAVRILEATGDADQRWLAGRYAILSGELGAARRLLSGTDAPPWSRVALLSAQREHAAAAEAALALMDEALSGVNRAALTRMMLDWAGSAATDAGSSATFLWAALGLAPSDLLRHEVEDRLLAIPEGKAGGTITDLAQRRLAETPDHLDARLRLARPQASTWPAWTLAHLLPVVAQAPRGPALEAATTISGLAVPDPLILGALTTLQGRFPGDPDVSRLRLSFATGLMNRDPVAGAAALQALVNDPAVGLDALSAQATATSDPSARRALWLELSRREGASARGEKARTEALSALLAEVSAQRDALQRQYAATRALQEPDGHDNSFLLYYSLPEGPERTAALWSQVERFPKGLAWCDELATRLVDAGADDENASRWSRSCGGGATTDARVLQGQVHGEPTLSLRPLPGRVEARVAATAALKVQQHRVDPETLFFATSGHPLNASLEASLVEPDAAWEIQLGVDHAGVTAIKPRGGGPLFAITARADTSRATALVVTQPLDVQVIRQDEDVAVGVLRDGQPVAGASITLVDDHGVVVRGKTDRGGVARVVTDPVAPLRIMARRGDGLGFAIASQPSAGATPPRPTFTIVPWDRANMRESQRMPVEIFGTLPAGAVDEALTLRCVRGSQLIDEVPVSLVGGVAHAEPWTLAGSDLVLVNSKGETLAESGASIAPSSAGALSLSWSDPSPGPGGRIEADVHALRSLPPGGISASYELRSSWSAAQQDLLLGPEGLHLGLDLGAAWPGQSVNLRVSVPFEGNSADVTVASIKVAGPVAPAALSLPGLVAAGQAIEGAVPAGTWLRARRGPLQVWARAEDPLVLPVAGQWQICAWREVCGPESTVLAGESRLDKSGVWTGEPSLATVLSDGIERAVILKRGDPLPRVERTDMALAWATIFNGADGDAIHVPLPSPPTPGLEVSGALHRGGASTLTLGVGLPPQTQLWAFLRDASDQGSLASPTPVAALWSALPARLGSLWRAHDLVGEPIARALLEEEERRAEGGPLQRLDYNFGLGERGGGLGGGGTAEGLGGFGSKGRGSGSSGYSPTIVGASRGGHPPSWDGRAIAVVTGTRPGDWSVKVPAWITAADLEVVAHLPEGRWTSRVVRLTVDGSPPIRRPDPPVVDWPQTWDGQPASLLPVALSLPVNAQPPALAALSGAGVSAARAPLQASLASGSDGLIGEVLARKALGLPFGELSSSGGANLPDSNQAARAEAALQLAPADPERALTMARRLLSEPRLPAWITARAGLALWVAGDPGALAALAGDGPTLAAARAIVGGEAEARYGGAWWATATSEAALPQDRALAIAALVQLAGDPLAPASPSKPAASLELLVEPPIVSQHGLAYARGSFDGPRQPDPTLGVGAELPVGRVTSVWVTVPASPVPTRLRCPTGAEIQTNIKWFDIIRSAGPQLIRCDLEGAEVGPIVLRATWYGPDGAPLAEGSAPLTVVEPRDGAPTDPMSPRERFGLGVALASAGDPAGMDLLAQLLATQTLPANVTAEASLARVRGAMLRGDARGLVAAVDAWRERSPVGELDLETSAAFAHAAAKAGDPERSLAAVGMILDARFKEELGAVNTVRGAGLELTALKLLRTLVARYPEVPTVVSARYLAPSMLLQRAEGDGDRLGYTRASLRHSAAGELAGFLLIHGDAEEAPQAAALLMSALDHLVDPSRSAALAGPLGRLYASSPQGWLLALSDARAQLATGSPRAALDVLSKVSAPEGRENALELTRGQALEALGRQKEALAAYAKSGDAEAMARSAWLTRSELALPPYLIVRPGDPSTLAVGMRPGAVGTLTATRISLEDALLAHDGKLDPNAFAVSGLGAPTPRLFTADAAGALPLPDLGFGAWLLEVRTENLLARSVLIRTDATLIVTDSDGASFTHLTDRAGAPLEGATVWLFDASGDPTPARTDAGGATWTPGSTAGALARLGDRYAWWQATEPAQSSSPPEPAESSYGDTLRYASEGYGELFKQQQGQKVQASGL